jgi:hypothetical protein
MEHIERFVGRRVLRSLRSDCYYGPEVFKVNAILLGFTHSNKTFIISQETGEHKYLPVKLITEDSLYNLKRAKLEESIWFAMATGMCKKNGLKIINGNGPTTKEIVMTDDKPFEVTEEEAAPINPDRLTIVQVNDMLSEMGKTHDFLRDGGYVTFSMTGNQMQARVFKSHCLGEYAR